MKLKKITVVKYRDENGEVYDSLERARASLVFREIFNSLCVNLDLADRDIHDVSVGNFAHFLTYKIVSGDLDPAKLKSMFDNVNFYEDFNLGEE